MHIIQRERLFNGDLLEVGHVVARPSSAQCGEIEEQSQNVLVLPFAGVFAKHDGPRRHVVATANHSVFVRANSPYRISYPGAIGDRCLTLRFSQEALSQLLPEVGLKNKCRAQPFAQQNLLSPQTMVQGSLLWRMIREGSADPLEVEESSVELLLSVLKSGSKTAFKSMSETSHRLNGNRASVYRNRIEATKEIISLAPERKWRLSELAALVNISSWHLAHVFRREVGASVYRYVLRARLVKALDLVLNTETEMTAIALDTGFASHSHFTARFRALFGFAPIALRRYASLRTAAQLRKIVTAPTLRNL